MINRRDVLKSLLALPAAFVAMVAGKAKAETPAVTKGWLQSWSNQLRYSTGGPRNSGTLVFDGRLYTMHNYEVSYERHDQLVDWRHGLGYITQQLVRANIDYWREPITPPYHSRISGRGQYSLRMRALSGTRDDIIWLCSRLGDVMQAKQNVLKLPGQVVLGGAILTSFGSHCTSITADRSILDNPAIIAYKADIPWFKAYGATGKITTAEGTELHFSNGLLVKRE